MPTTTDELHLEPAAQAALDATRSGLVERLGDAVVALILYGPAIERSEAPPADSASLLVVLESVDGDRLERVREVVEGTPVENRPSLMIVAEDEVAASTDVFPVRYRDIQRRHRLLHGRDVLSNLAISREHLRLRCEQELRNLLLRMRVWYVRHAGLPEQLEGVLVRSAGPFARDLAVLVELQTGSEPEGREAVLAAAEGMGLDVEPLRTAERLATGVGDAGDLRTLYGEFVELVRRAAVAVDTLGEDRP